MVNAIHQVDVEVPGRTEHHRVARRPAAGGVCGKVLGSAVRLHLDDLPANPTIGAVVASRMPSSSGARSRADGRTRRRVGRPSATAPAGSRQREKRRDLARDERPHHGADDRA